MLNTIAVIAVHGIRRDVDVVVMIFSIAGSITTTTSTTTGEQNDTTTR
jgi:hypothetical protein